MSTRAGARGTDHTYGCGRLLLLHHHHLLHHLRGHKHVNVRGAAGSPRPRTIMLGSMAGGLAAGLAPTATPWYAYQARRRPAQARPRNAQRDQRMGKAGVPCASRGRRQVRLRETSADQIGHEHRTQGQDGRLGERHSHMRKEQRVALVKFGGNCRSSHTCLTRTAGRRGRRAHARCMTVSKPPRSAARQVSEPHSSAKKTTTAREARRGKREACRIVALPSLWRRPPVRKGG